MLETLTNKMSTVLRSIRGLNRLTEDNVTEALKEVRMALLSADVHFKVAKEFIDTVRTECLGQSVINSVTPGQQMVKCIHDHLIVLLGEGATKLSTKKPLHVLMVGLHGAGKTTTSAKLGRYLKKQGYNPILVACDVYRPAAIEQLRILAQQEQLQFYSQTDQTDVLKIAKEGLRAAQAAGATAIIFDTAGRLQIDTSMLDEIKALKSLIQPEEVLLVADSAMGQEAVNVAEQFHAAVTLTGIALTKLDGDARGGAALSMKSITGVPIKFMATGEKVADFDIFYPERMAQRILGMGDVVSLVEKAGEHMNEAQAKNLTEKLKKADFDLEDFLVQLRQIKKMGSLASLMKMIPGMGGMDIGPDAQEKFKRTEAIISSMTLKERRNPNLLDGNRRLRISRGSGTKVQDINQLLKQFLEMKKFMKSMKGLGGRDMLSRLGKGFPGMPGM